ncbi:hypothetical protein OSB04_001446 [Centaurea solstitialis]|uniref:RING-type E3 ubiquitin transferase n=1 Tax=Centaurea solstitialis TaxID=347529 RepID=A0AA38U2Q2_9ASTR|nr:hypothetical protein OSB04_001446 [Centaurea solstitialis]
MNLDPYPLHIPSTPTTFYGCPCGRTIRAYSVSPIVSENNFNPEILTESLLLVRPLPYPYTWYVFEEEAAIVDTHDLQAFQETHQHPPSYASYLPQEEQEAIYIDGIEGGYYSNDESIDDVDVNMDQIMNDSFQQASDHVAFSGLTKKEISKNLRVTKYRHGGEEESEICVVCQVEFEKNERVGVLHCKHRFHAECIKEWLLRKNLCPLCKTQGLKV